MIRVTVYDYRRTPPQPLAQRLVYRRAGRRLQIHLGDDHPSYTAGERVNLALSVANEKGQPLPATLGVDVTDAALAFPDDNSPAHWLLAGALDLSQERNDADFLLSQSAEASLALDLVLGSRGVPRLPESAPGRSATADEDRPPMMSDNLVQIRAKYEESLGRYRAQRTWVPDALNIVSFFGGFGLALLVAMMAILNILTGVRIWVPALIAAVACLIIGAILVNPDRLGESRAEVVAFQPFRLPLSADKAANSPIAPGAAAGLPSSAAASRVDKSPVPLGGHADQGTGKPGIDAKTLPSRIASSVPPPVASSDVPPFPICQYSYAASGKPANSTATLAWYPLLTAGADGRARVAFELPGTAATYRLRADGHGGGRFGVVETEIRSRPPLGLQARLPGEVTAGDRIGALVTIVNHTAQAQPTELTVGLGFPFANAVKIPPRQIKVPGQQQICEDIALPAAALPGTCRIEFRAASGAFSDRVIRRVRIVAPGVPVERAYSGLLAENSNITVELPPQWESDSLQVRLIGFPSVLTELQQAADGIASRRPSAWNRLSVRTLSTPSFCSIWTSTAARLPA